VQQFGRRRFVRGQQVIDALEVCYAVDASRDVRCCLDSEAGSSAEEGVPGAESSEPPAGATASVAG
jgi:hypothetical protein